MKETLVEAYKEGEYARKRDPYKVYLEAIEAVFDLSIIDSFADLGCSNGKLMECMADKYPHIDMLGLEYFDWAKEYAHPKIKDKIQLCDLGKLYTYQKQYDLVNCSEVGEHLDPTVENTFINNVTNAAKDILILTWSNAKSDTNDQHVNPRPQSYVKAKLMEKKFAYWKEATEKIKNHLRINLEGIGNNWWPDNIMVFKKDAFIPVKSRYFIQGIHTDNDSHAIDLKRCSLFNYGSSDLQTEFKYLTEKIKSAAAEHKSMSILRASDGDYFFLKKIPIGSATPGKRALTVSYDAINMSLFRSYFWHNDIIALNLAQHSIASWRSFIMTELPVKIYHKFFKKPFPLFDHKKVRYAFDMLARYKTITGIWPSFSSWLYSFKRGNLYLEKARTIIDGRAPSCEAVYALMTTKWLFKNFKNQIGIIANEEKVKLIKELMKHKEYQEYIGVDYFTDYIEVPQKGAANEIEKLAESLAPQVSNSSAKIFIVGAGSSKIALIPLLKAHSNAVFIDAGACTDALAGVVCQERPYFADWINYRLKNWDYTKIDFMDQGNPAWKREHYKTKNI